MSAGTAGQSALRAWLTGPQGWRTTHFWGPVANWGFVIAVSARALARCGPHVLTDAAQLHQGAGAGWKPLRWLRSCRRCHRPRVSPLSVPGRGVSVEDTLSSFVNLQGAIDSQKPPEQLSPSMTAVMAVYRCAGAVTRWRRAAPLVRFACSPACCLPAAPSSCVSPGWSSLATTSCSRATRPMSASRRSTWRGGGQLRTGARGRSRCSRARYHPAWAAQRRGERAGAGSALLRRHSLRCRIRRGEEECVKTLDALCPCRTQPVKKE